MGLEAAIPIPEAGVPDWGTVREKMSSSGVPVDLKMIDGRLVLPSEIPPREWQELRVGTAEGMITIRRRGATLSFVVFGNASVELVRTRDRLAAVFSGEE